MKYLWLSILVLLTATACGSVPSAPESYQVIHAARLQPGMPLPALTEPPILTIHGLITSTPIDLDLPALEQFTQIEYTVDDPFLKQPTRYQGVLLSEVLAYVGVNPAAIEISAVALNDYAVRIPLADIMQWPVMIATMRNGSRLAIKDNGPLEIVFPYHVHAFDQSKYNEMWVWQLRSIEVQ